MNCAQVAASAKDGTLCSIEHLGISAGVSHLHCHLHDKST